MTIHVTFSPETEARLRERAAAAGKDVETLVREVIEETLGGAPVVRGAGANGQAPTLRELIAVMRSYPGGDDGWTGGVEEAVRLGNQPPPAGSPWGS
jgi:plasmid stability protein